MKKLVVTLILSIVYISYSSAQDSIIWSLEKCIEYALENNIQIMRQKLNTDLQKNELEQSKLNRLPNLNAESNYGHEYGFNWVQQIATNVDQDIRSFNAGISSSVNVFNGLYNTKSIKRNQYNLMAATALTNEMQNNIALQITGQYLQILFDKELLNVAKEQEDVTKQQAYRTKRLVDAGSQAMGSYLEIKSQAAKEALNVTQQENNLSISLLNLAQLLDLEEVSLFDIISPDMPEMEELKLDKPISVYTVALDIMPQIQGASLMLESSKLGVDVAKSGYYPSLVLNGQWGARASWLIDDPEGINRSLREQINSTKSTYIGARLRIPIFNNLQTRNRVKNARIGVLDAQYSLDQKKLALRKDIQQAHADALASYKKYISSQEAVASYEESFRYTEKKFNVGLVNTVEYSTAKNEYTKAQSSLLQAKYEYVLRSKILDFYKGLPITL